MINKGFILKTAAVASCVVVLGVTGCQGGVDEAAAVKNKGTVSIEIHEAKGEEIDDISERDREETVEAVDRSNGHEGRITQAEDNDTERNEMENRRGQEATGEAEPSEDGDSVLTEEDGSDVGGDTGTEDAACDDESDTASTVYSEPDMGDGEYTDDEDGWYEPDTAGVEEAEGSGSESEPYESESYDDSNEQYGDSEYSEDSSDGWSDGATDNLIYQGEFLVTFYDDCEACCVRAGATTASGVYPTAGHTIAVDGYEFGTVLYIEGFGYYVVEDRGVPYGMIDIYVNDHSEIPSYGITTASVYLVS